MNKEAIKREIFFSYEIYKAPFNLLNEKTRAFVKPNAFNSALANGANEEGLRRIYKNMDNQYNGILEELKNQEDPTIKNDLMWLGGKILGIRDAYAHNLMVLGINVKNREGELVF